MKNYLYGAFLILAMFFCACRADAQSHLAFRLVDDAPNPGAADVEMLSDPREGSNTSPLAVKREVLLDEHAIQSVEMVSNRFGPRIKLNMTPDGSEKLKQITSQNINHRLVIVLDGKVIIAPRIASTVSKSVEIALGSNATDQQTNDFYGQLRAIIPSPTTQPATDQSAK